MIEFKKCVKTYRSLLFRHYYRSCRATPTINAKYTSHRFRWYKYKHSTHTAPISTAAERRQKLARIKDARLAAHIIGTRSIITAGTLSDETKTERSSNCGEEEVAAIVFICISNSGERCREWIEWCLMNLSVFLGKVCFHFIVSN